jgi:hypothetical protein
LDCRPDSERSLKEAVPRLYLESVLKKMVLGLANLRREARSAWRLRKWVWMKERAAAKPCVCELAKVGLAFETYFALEGHSYERS